MRLVFDLLLLLFMFHMRYLGMVLLAESKLCDPHEHVYEKWYPHSRTTQWRRCVIPGCQHFQVREAPKV